MRKTLLKSFAVIAALALTTSANAQTGYKYDSDCNQFSWFKRSYSVSYMNSSWQQLEERPVVEESGSTYTITYPVATGDNQWYNQFYFETDIETNASTTYQFSVKLKSNVDIKVVLKEDKGILWDYESDNRIQLTANEDKVFELDDIEGKNISGLKIFFGFGGNPDNTVITISDIVFREKGCDDNTYVKPSVLDLKIGDAAFEGTSQTMATYQGALKKGTAYTFGGKDASVVTADGFYYNPDYFTKNADGTYTFNAISGNYNITANTTLNYFHIYPLNAEGKPATYADGGATYVVGGDGFGTPTYANASNWGAANNWNPQLDKNVSAAQIKDKYYRLTLTIGKQLKADNVNFKFYGAASGWDGELKQDQIEIVEGQGDDLFVIVNEGNDNGNIKAAAGATFTDGDTYTLFLDRTGDKAKLSVVKADDETGASTGIKSISASKSADAAIYTLSGVRVAQPKQAGVYIQNGKKVVIK